MKLLYFQNHYVRDLSIILDSRKHKVLELDFFVSLSDGSETISWVTLKELISATGTVIW